MNSIIVGIIAANTQKGLSPAFILQLNTVRLQRFRNLPVAVLLAPQAVWLWHSCSYALLCQGRGGVCSKHPCATCQRSK